MSRKYKLTVTYTQNGQAQYYYRTVISDPDSGAKTLLMINRKRIVDEGGLEYLADDIMNWIPLHKIESVSLQPVDDFVDSEGKTSGEKLAVKPVGKKAKV